MILDTSAIVAILMEESGAEDLIAKLHGAEPVGVGAPTLLETAIVLSHRSERNPLPYLERFLRELEAAVLSFDDSHRREAVQAFLRFGKGRHPAALNFGDCMAYATAKLARQPLLCIGNDFAKTDLDLV